jgi:hypothetical protein
MKRHEDGHEPQTHNDLGGHDSLSVGMVQHLTEQTEKLYKMPEFVTGNI